MPRRFPCILSSFFLSFFYYVHIPKSKIIQTDNGTETSTNVTTTVHGAAPRRNSDGGGGGGGH